MLKNIKINLNNWNCGTIENDAVIELKLREWNVAFSKEVHFENDEVFGDMKFFDINIKIDELQKEKLDCFVKELAEVGGNGSIKTDIFQYYLNDYLDNIK